VYIVNSWWRCECRGQSASMEIRSSSSKYFAISTELGLSRQYTIADSTKFFAVSRIIIVQSYYSPTDIILPSTPSSDYRGNNRLLWTHRSRFPSAESESLRQHKQGLSGLIPISCIWCVWQWWLSGQMDMDIFILVCLRNASK